MKLKDAKDVLFVFGESDSAIRAYFGGDKSALEEAVVKLWNVVDDSILDSESDRLERLTARISGPKSWTPVYESKLDKIKIFLQDFVQKLETNKARPQFKHLYEGTPSDEELESSMTLVQAELTSLLSRYGALREDVSTAVGKVQEIHDSDPSLKGTEAALALNRLSEALLQDLSELIHVVHESIKNLSNVESLAIVYDTLAEELHAYETAGTFLKEMTSRLDKAHSA